MSWPPTRTTRAYVGSDRDADPAERFESKVWETLSAVMKLPPHQRAHACAAAVQQLVRDARSFGMAEIEREQQAQMRRALGGNLRKDVPR